MAAPREPMPTLALLPLQKTCLPCSSFTLKYPGPGRRGTAVFFVSLFYFQIVAPLLPLFREGRSSLYLSLLTSLQSYQLIPS